MSHQELDLACMARMEAGDQRALAELYDRYSALLFSVALRIVRGGAEAEDVLQEAWLQVWRRSGTYDPRRGTVAAWLLTVARTRALDAYRSAASRQRGDKKVEVEMAAPMHQAPAEAVHGLLNERIRAAMSALPEREREVLEVAYFEGLSQSEIASRFNTPLGTVKTRTRQGLLRLRELLPNEEWM